MVIGASPTFGAGGPTLEGGVRLGIVGVTGVVWISDGYPGSRECWAMN